MSSIFEKYPNIFRIIESCIVPEEVEMFSKMQDDEGLSESYEEAKLFFIMKAVLYGMEFMVYIGKKKDENHDVKDIGDMAKSMTQVIENQLFLDSIVRDTETFSRKLKASLTGRWSAYDLENTNDDGSVCKCPVCEMFRKLEYCAEYKIMAKNVLRYL